MAEYLIHQGVPPGARNDHGETALQLADAQELFRWRYIKDFYSNEGVLPNHNHIFLLHDQTRVWSALHAFSR